MLIFVYTLNMDDFINNSRIFGFKCDGFYKDSVPLYSLSTNSFFYYYVVEHVESSLLKLNGFNWLIFLNLLVVSISKENLWKGIKKIVK